MPGDRKHRSRYQLSRVWAVALLSLIAVSWHLWIPRADALEVPMVDGISVLHLFLGWIAALGITGLDHLVILVTGRRWFWWLVSASLGRRVFDEPASITTLGLSNRDLCNRLCDRWIVNRVENGYDLWQPASTCTARPENSTTSSYTPSDNSSWKRSWDVVGGIPEFLVRGDSARLAILFPVGELVIGLGLLVPPTRRVAGCLAIAFHLTLLLVLGPWGLDHSHGVLVWNVVLIVQAYLLFVSPEQETDRERTRTIAFPR